jgi:hypothetical protein
MGTLDITIDQGANFQRVLTIKDELNVEIDLTGYTFKSQIRETYDSNTVIAEFTFTLQDQITDTGKVNWDLANNAVTSLVLDRATKYKYDVEMTSAGGIKTRILEGTATISPEVTKS